MEGRDRITEKVLNVQYSAGPEGAWFPAKIAIFTRATLSEFPYQDFYATIEKAILLSDHWKISFE